MLLPLLGISWVFGIFAVNARHSHIPVYFFNVQLYTGSIAHNVIFDIEKNVKKMKTEKEKITKVNKDHELPRNVQYHKSRSMQPTNTIRVEQVYCS